LAREEGFLETEGKCPMAIVGEASARIWASGDPVSLLKIGELLAVSMSKATRRESTETEK